MDHYLPLTQCCVHEFLRARLLPGGIGLIVDQSGISQDGNAEFQLVPGFHTTTKKARGCMTGLWTLEGWI